MNTVNRKINKKLSISGVQLPRVAICVNKHRLCRTDLFSCEWHAIVTEKGVVLKNITYQTVRCTLTQKSASHA